MNRRSKQLTNQYTRRSTRTDHSLAVCASTAISRTRSPLTRAGRKVRTRSIEPSCAFIYPCTRRQVAARETRLELNRSRRERELQMRMIRLMAVFAVAMAVLAAYIL